MFSHVKSGEKSYNKRTKMKRVRRIITIKNWMDTLYFVFHNFFYTDLLMHKQGVVYEKNSYQKKTIARLEILLKNVRRVIKKNKKEEMIKELKKPYEEYLQRLRKDDEKWLGKTRPLRVYMPEKDTQSMVFTHHRGVCQEILELIENNKMEKKDIDNVLKINSEILKGMHESFRKELQDYGYVIKKDKILKKMKKTIKK